MCGLAGFITKDRKPPAISARQIRRSLLRCAIRGTDATGIFWEEENDFKIFKAPVPAKDFVQYVPWDRIEKSPLCIMHTRAATQGDPSVFSNNHPLIDDKVVLAHNGMIFNSDDFVNKNICDSLAILEAINRVAKGSELTTDIIKNALFMLTGTIAFTLFDTIKRQLFLLSSGNPLIIGQKENTVLWGSTSDIICGMRPYMISEMVNNYLVRVQDNYMKGENIELGSKHTRQSYTSYKGQHSYWPNTVGSTKEDYENDWWEYDANKHEFIMKKTNLL